MGSQKLKGTWGRQHKNVIPSDMLCCLWSQKYKVSTPTIIGKAPKKGMNREGFSLFIPKYLLSDFKFVPLLETSESPTFFCKIIGWRNCLGEPWSSSKSKVQQSSKGQAIWWQGIGGAACHVKVPGWWLAPSASRQGCTAPTTYRSWHPGKSTSWGI